MPLCRLWTRPSTLQQHVNATSTRTSPLTFVASGQCTPAIATQHPYLLFFFFFRKMWQESFWGIFEHSREIMREMIFQIQKKKTVRSKNSWDSFRKGHWTSWVTGRVFWFFYGVFGVFATARRLEDQQVLHQILSVLVCANRVESPFSLHAENLLDQISPWSETVTETHSLARNVIEDYSQAARAYRHSHTCGRASCESGRSCRLNCIARNKYGALVGYNQTR